MTKLNLLPLLLLTLILQSCISSKDMDPFESSNRKIYKFNVAVDRTILKPTAIYYTKLIPAPVRASVNHFYDNLNMIPTVANDLLQGDFGFALKDSWRFVINTSFGLAGLFDPASDFGLSPHSNDLGLTLIKWGDTHSSFVMIPLLGPSTIRDGMGLMFEYTFLTPYPYLRSDAILYGLLGLRYVDLRSQLLDTDKLIAESLDPYTFVRDAYLQHRGYLNHHDDIDDIGELYVDDQTTSNDKT